MGNFAKNTTITFGTKVIVFIVGVGTSIIIARILGPEGKGIYKLALLLPSLIVTLANFGIGPATVYFVGQNKHDQKTIFGNNLILGLLTSTVSLVAAIIVIVFFKGVLFEGVPFYFLLIALPIIPLKLFSQYLRNLLLGLREIKRFNLYKIVQKSTFLVFVGIALGALQAGVIGALISSMVSSILALGVSLYWIYDTIGYPKRKPEISYLKDATTYGIKAHLGNIMGFLNYRFDMFLVSAFLNPAAVGYYSIAVGMAEKIWMVSRSASTVLFPRVSSETNEKRRKEFTPIVSRNVFMISLIGAIALFFLNRWAILLLYSKAYLSSVQPLQILLPGIVALSVARVLSNDLAGRGKPMLNTYMGAITVITNIGLNIIWIPQYGINGAALASVVAYSVQLVGKLSIYCYISGNNPLITLVPQKSDIQIYKRYGISVYRKVTRW